ncbi:hypothetical protein [Actinacidiphila rubida]|uniref:Uncharacterized protein n=1 Tax=Actinacidiphila rubida TaxID=310780 RepID=A0A1H8NQ33_9ACTN|nr:hypothetical protein [Actinacidiphila rubida]SEO31478.1 hypothetical protein SAMN05216267_102311 [Actinacidiphila rubida]
MGKGLGAAGRRAVTGSDPATGRVRASAAVCASLVAAGLAVPHGRGGHHSHYLTTEGRRLRAELAASGAPPDAAQPVPSPTTGSFTADDGTGRLPPVDPARRAAEVASAWEGLLQIRSVLADGESALPAPWERERVVHAVALALEAAGCPPARAGSPGYRVTASAHPDTAEIAWSAASPADALARCAELLAARGWQSTRHRTRAGDPFLLTSPAKR